MQYNFSEELSQTEQLQNGSNKQGFGTTVHKFKNIISKCNEKNCIGEYPSLELRYEKNGAKSMKEYLVDDSIYVYAFYGDSQNPVSYYFSKVPLYTEDSYHSPFFEYSPTGGQCSLPMEDRVWTVERVSLATYVDMNQKTFISCVGNTIFYNGLYDKLYADRLYDQPYPQRTDFSYMINYVDLKEDFLDFLSNKGLPSEYDDKLQEFTDLVDSINKVSMEKTPIKLTVENQSKQETVEKRGLLKSLLSKFGKNKEEISSLDKSNERKM